LLIILKKRLQNNKDLPLPKDITADNKQSNDEESDIEPTETQVIIIFLKIISNIILHL
jgi:hypothetical protein